MSNRSRLLRLAAIGLAASGLWAANLEVGTWKLDVLHSKFSPGPAPTSEVRVYTETPSGIQVSIKTVDANGKVATREYPTNFDGRDYVQPGLNPGESVALTRDNDHHASAVLKHADKVMVNVDRLISADGNTMTITYRGTKPNGDPIENIEVYQKIAGTTTSRR